jgi:hypothetical protein
VIPWGHWRPDAETLNAPLVVSAKNCLPAGQGFRPLLGPLVVESTIGAVVTDDLGNPVTDESGEEVTAEPTALNGRVFGAVTVLLEDGSNVSFAGTSTKLYQLSSASSWADITRVSGGDYATAVGERWRFDIFGDNLIGTNFTDDVQKFDVTGGTNFAALGGTPPKARYIAIVREFVVLGCLSSNQRSIQWSSIGNSEEWTPGTNSGDTQVFPSGGPVRGLIGGEVGYVFQDEKITRMIFAPGSEEVFQFDEVEGGRGLKAPNSLVRLGSTAFYFAGDGFYKFDLVSGASTPIGVGKWARAFIADLRAGTEASILSAVSPTERAILFPYISRSNASTTPDRVLIYDWTIDEATTADITIEAIAQWLSQGYTLDTMNSFGTLDTLPYSLDSPFWKGGTPLLALFNSDHQLSYLQGEVMAAEFVTGDGQGEQRALIKATRPHVDTTDVTVAVSMRERDADNWLFPSEETMEDTGEIPAWTSGNVARARLRIGAGANWTYAKGIKTILGAAGKR